MATKKKVSKEVIHAIGRRKTSVARVYMQEGKGQVIVNGKTLNDYFGETTVFPSVSIRPCKVVGANADFDFTVNVKGGGLTGLADAISLAIARALCKHELIHNPQVLEISNEDEEGEGSEDLAPKTWKGLLKSNELLTRIDKKVERKKYGYRKARKKEQYSKR